MLSPTLLMDVLIKNLSTYICILIKRMYIHIKYVKLYKKLKASWIFIKVSFQVCIKQSENRTPCTGTRRGMYIYVVLYTALFWNAGKLALQPRYGVFVLLSIRAFKHSNYVFITI